MPIQTEEPVLKLKDKPPILPLSSAEVRRETSFVKRNSKAVMSNSVLTPSATHNDEMGTSPSSRAKNKFKQTSMKMLNKKKEENTAKKPAISSKAIDLGILGLISSSDSGPTRKTSKSKGMNESPGISTRGFGSKSGRTAPLQDEIYNSRKNVNKFG